MNETILTLTLKIYEEKLIELMGMKRYKKFAATVGKAAFMAEIESMPEGDFKDFCKANFDKITNDDDIDTEV